MHRVVGNLLILLGLCSSIKAQHEQAENFWADLAEQREADPQLWTRDVSCLGGLDTPYDSSCWNALDISKFLTQWNASAPRCTPHDLGTGCCGPSSNPTESWSSCFLRMALESSAGYNCDVVNTKNCQLETFQVRSLINSSLVPDVRYVVRNIYAMNNLFNTWYESMQYATTQASLWIPNVINFVDPLKKTNVVLTDVFLSLIFGFAFLGMPGLSKVFGVEIEQVITKAIIINIQQAPNVGRSLWPQGTSDSRSYQIGDLQGQMASVNTELGAAINNALVTIMNDIPSFLAFGASGIYSNSTPPSLPGQTEALNAGFKTFLLTAAMSHNNWRGSFNDVPQGVSAGPDGDPVKQFGPVGRKCSYRPDGLCVGKKDWSGFVSPDSKRAYVLDQSDHKNEPTSLQMTQAIVDKGWSSLEAVLDGAYNCSMAAGMRPGGTKPVMEMSKDGGLDVSCMSQLPMIIQCQDVCPAPLASNVQCPFPKWDGCKH